MARNKQKAAKGGAPISSHPAFPAIVALWFAALFGIGSLVLPTALLESIITGIGISTVVPAAAPPLGFTARGLIALLVAGIGLAAGLLLARKVAQSQSPAKERSRDLQLNDADRHPDAPAKRPISARRELGSEGLGPVDDPWKFEDEWAGDDDDGYDYDEYVDGEDRDDQQAEPSASPAPVAGNIPGRRRALSVTDDSGPSDYLQTVPLPGQSYDGALELDILEEEPTEDEVAVEEFAEETAGLRNEVHSAPEAAVEAPAPEFPVAETSAAEPNFSADGAASPDSAALFAQPVAPSTHGMPDTENDFATSLVQEESMNQPTEPSMPSFAATFAEPAEPVSDPATAPGRNALSDLGMAELVERFATAMQAKAERDEQRDEQTAPTFAAMSSGFDGANPFADRAGDADLDAFGAAASLPFTSPLVSEPVATESVAAEEAPMQEPVEAETAAPMVFRRSGAAEEVEAPAPAAEEAPSKPTFGQERMMPSALQPVSMLDDEDDEDDDTAHAPLSIDFARQRPFADPVARVDNPLAQPEAAFAAPSQFSAPEPAAEEEDESQDAYSSLLNMKSKLSGQDFVRVEDESDTEDTLPEPVVVFPGQQAAEAPDEHNSVPRMFDAPPHGASPGANPVPHPTTPPSAPSDPTETERALREALEKLQRMSGAA